MIISKTPVRISIGGGGTDLPSYYKRFGSRFVSAAIDKYIYIIVQERHWYDEHLIRYSKTEVVREIGEIENELVREAMRLVKIKDPIEVVSMSEVGGRSGLGSSGAFTVGLLNALHALKRESVSREQLAEEACQIAIDVLKKPSGKQDEYIAAFGGFTSFEIDKKGKVSVKPLEFESEFVTELEHYLFLFDTGITRDSAAALKVQNEATKRDDKGMIANLKQVESLGSEIASALKQYDARRFGRLMHKHWLLKRKRGKTTTAQIDKWYEAARESGALGGKIMGAGGGGFFLFYCDNGGRKLIKAMEGAGLRHVPFGFDYRGSKLMAEF